MVLEKSGATSEGNDDGSDGSRGWTCGFESIVVVAPSVIVKQRYRGLRVQPMIKYVCQHRTAMRNVREIDRGYTTCTTTYRTVCGADLWPATKLLKRVEEFLLCPPNLVLLLLLALNVGIVVSILVIETSLLRIR